MLPLYYGSYFISLLGNSVATVALPVLILLQTGDVLATGSVALVGGIATFLSGILSGPLIDRFNRSLVAGIADILSAVSMASLALIGTFGEITLPWFLLFAFVSGLGDMPAWNAREAMIYDVQRRSSTPLQTLVGLRETLSALAIVLGPTAAALFMTLLSGPNVLWITAGTSLVAALLAFFLAKAFAATPYDADEGLHYWANLRAGRRYIMHREQSVLRRIIVLNLASVVLVTVLQSLLLPVFMTLAGKPDFTGYSVAAVGVGLLFGGILYTVWLQRYTPWVIVAAASVANVFTLGMLLQAEAFITIVSWCFAFGATSAVAGAILGVLSLQLTAETFRGRVNGLQNSIAMVI